MFRNKDREKLLHIMQFKQHEKCTLAINSYYWPMQQCMRKGTINITKKYFDLWNTVWTRRQSVKRVKQKDVNVLCLRVKVDS